MLEVIDNTNKFKNKVNTGIEMSITKVCQNRNNDKIEIIKRDNSAKKLSLLNKIIISEAIEKKTLTT